ncbi:MAG: NADH-quinone oxidoreductase subunit NuoF [Bacteroidota bacterium]
MPMYRSHVLVCAGAGCVSSGCQAVKQALLEQISKYGLENEVRVVETGCMGPCDLGPVVVIYPEGVFYKRVKPEDTDDIAGQHLLKGRIVERLVYHTPSNEAKPTFKEIEFFSKQTRIALRNAGIIDPERVEEYIARDGYRALGKVLTEMQPEDVIKAVKDSGLRGRGGAGFPTGLKWELTANAKGSPKYVVCNADEGDPGAFMDRSILEGDPHSVLEAMAICGYAIGAQMGYIYVRAEYPLAVEHLSTAIKQAREYGLLGENIFGTGFGFDVEIRMGAGAFVCGEETALIASIEGKRGEPKPKPPFPASEGLFGKPTVLNNVETWANIPPIILNGAAWFAAIGTEKSKGTKVFALAGKINNTGLVEVPMGTSLGEIIYGVGGGIPGGKKFKAAQTGGPSGGCITKDNLNVPVDYDSLKALGTYIGSGGLIIMDEDTCMVDIAKYFMEFVQDESCGKCAPCRIGTKRMLEILQRITRGQGRQGDIELLIELSEGIQSAALCGLGQGAPNPVLSTIRYFRDEYEAHIKDKHCPASVCASLFKSPCQNTCPAGVDVPIYIDAVKNGKPAEAYATVRNENPFPIVCGRVCHHPCERKCRRSQLDEPLAIRALKRYAADYVLNSGNFPPLATRARKPQKVAVIGAGPAGLTAAHYLAKQGYGVTVFEALPVAGGMMAVGIPEYRLPKKALNAEIDAIKQLGVEIRTGVKIGEGLSLADLRRDHDAVFIAVGAHVDQRLGIPGEDQDGVLSGITFLRELNLGRTMNLKGKKVAVIGGGNVAADAARSALQMGAEAVSVYYRRTREEMPAMPEEIEEMEHEGIAINYLVAPLEVIGEKGRVKGLRLTKMQLGEFDKSGRRRPAPVAGSEFDVDADVIIAAIGQSVETAPLGTEIKLTRWGTVAADAETMATSVPGIFAGGDCVSGPDTVITAIADGKKAAAAIDRYLGGDGMVTEPLTIERRVSGTLIEQVTPRQKCGLQGFNEAQACAEASRCLRCDVAE